MFSILQINQDVNRKVIRDQICTYQEQKQCRDSLKSQKKISKIRVYFNREIKVPKTEEMKIGLLPQLVTDGALILQAVGKARALVTFNDMPNCALFLNASHKHCASVFNTDLRPEQHVPSGVFTVLPAVTYDRQSAMFSITVEQSAAGAGAPVWWAESTSPAYIAAAEMHRIRTAVVVAIFAGKLCFSASVCVCVTAERWFQNEGFW